MSDRDKTFRYKLDFYYQSALIYLLTLIAYGGIRGSLVEAKFSYVLDDPLLYVIIAFVLISFGALGLNAMRNRRLTVAPDALLFQNRFHERRIPVAEIEWMHVGREARVQTGGRFQVIVIKLKGNRRPLRIRVGRYERDRELLAEMHRIAGKVPRRKSRWRRSRFVDR